MERYCDIMFFSYMKLKRSTVYTEHNRNFDDHFKQKPRAKQKWKSMHKHTNTDNTMILWNKSSCNQPTINNTWKYVAAVYQQTKTIYRNLTRSLFSFSIFFLFLFLCIWYLLLLYLRYILYKTIFNVVYLYGCLDLDFPYSFPSIFLMQRWIFICLLNWTSLVHLMFSYNVYFIYSPFLLLLCFKIKLSTEFKQYMQSYIHINIIVIV